MTNHTEATGTMNQDDARRSAAVAADLSVRQREEGILRTVAFVFGLCISAVGAVGILVPSGLVWLAQQFVTSGAFGFYVIAMVRIIFGLILISVASASRAPKALRILGYVIFILGITTALTGLMAVERGGAAIDWWWHQGSGVWRLIGGLVLALGGFVAYACAPARRAKQKQPGPAI